MNKPNMIIIMDGYGISEEKKGNAIEMEGSPNVKALMKEYPSTLLGASGLSVGLPDGQMGVMRVVFLILNLRVHSMTICCRRLKVWNFWSLRLTPG